MFPQDSRVSAALRSSSDVAAYCPRLEYPASPAHARLRLPQYLLDARREIFGAAPDALAVALRTAELERFVWATPLRQLLEEIDPRFAYDAREPEGWTVDPRLFGVTVGDCAPARVLTSEAINEPSASGRWVLHYSIEPLGGGSIRVRETYPTLREWQVDRPELDPSAGFEISLPEPGVVLSVLNHTAAPSFVVRVVRRGQRGWQEIVERVEGLSTQTRVGLFGADRTEPWRSLRNVWEQHEAVSMRAAALGIAVAMRTEALRGA